MNPAPLICMTFCVYQWHLFILFCNANSCAGFSSACSISFICVQMNYVAVSSYSYSYITEHEGSVHSCIDGYLYRLISGNTVFLSSGRGQMKMSLGDYASVIRLYRISVFCSNLNARCSFQMTRKTDWRVDSQVAGVSGSQLNLSLFSGRPQNSNSLKGSLRTCKGYTLFSNKAAGNIFFYL